MGSAEDCRAYVESLALFARQASAFLIAKDTRMW